LRRVRVRVWGAVFSCVVGLIWAGGLGAASSVAVQRLPAAAGFPYAVSVSPGALVAGSSGNAVSFVFNAVRRTAGQVSVVVPAVVHGSPWTAPQSLKPARAGYVAASRRSCQSASVSSITEAAAGHAWKIVIDASCARGDRFALVYGQRSSGGSGVTAPTLAGTYTFKTGQGSAMPSSQPVVRVVAGPAAFMSLTGSQASAAGDQKSVTVVMRDRFLNLATGYRGLVHFSSSDSHATLPGDYSFTAADAGQHTFVNAFTLTTSGVQKVIATDTARPTLTGTLNVAVSPGPAASFRVSGLTTGTAGVAQTVTVTALDAFGNTAPDYRGTVNFEIGCFTNLGENLCFETPKQAATTVLPANYTFDAQDAGSHTFTDGVTITGVLDSGNSWTLLVSDNANSFLSGSQQVRITPAATARLGLANYQSDNAALAGQTVHLNVDVVAYDAYDNVNYNDNGPVTLSVTRSSIFDQYSGTLNQGTHTFSWPATPPDSSGLTFTVATGGRTCPGPSCVQFDTKDIHVSGDSQQVQASTAPDGNPVLQLAAGGTLEVVPNTVVLLDNPVILSDGSIALNIQGQSGSGSTFTASVLIVGTVDESGNLVTNAAQLPQQGDPINIDNSIAPSFACSGYPTTGYGYTCRGYWDSGTTYAVGDVVTATDGKLYQNPNNNNTGHDPRNLAGWWTSFKGPTNGTKTWVNLPRDPVLGGGNFAALFTITDLCPHGEHANPDNNSDPDCLPN
jgi:hypothetical protein